MDQNPTFTLKLLDSLNTLLAIRKYILILEK